MSGPISFEIHLIGHYAYIYIVYIERVLCIIYILYSLRIQLYIIICMHCISQT